jgi:hypothetical protein
VLTSPAAFFFAGVVDVGAFAFAALRGVARERLGSLARKHL